MPSNEHPHDNGHMPPSTGLKDPVCGMNVTTDSVHHCDYQGQHFYFCNPKCLTKFQLDPIRYLTPQSTDSIAPTEIVIGVEYTCPMHPEIVQASAGTCPKCGMALEPMQPSLDEQENPELVDFRHRFGALYR